MLSVCASLSGRRPERTVSQRKWLGREHSRINDRLYNEKEDILIKRFLDVLSQCLGDGGGKEIYSDTRRWEVQVPADPWSHAIPIARAHTVYLKFQLNFWSQKVEG